MAEFILRPLAARDLEDIEDYFAAYDVKSALRLITAERDTFELLANVPGIGRLRRCDHPGFEGVRTFPIRGYPKYLIFYRPILDGIEILRVIHGSRDIDRVLRDES